MTQMGPFPSLKPMTSGGHPPFSGSSCAVETNFRLTTCGCSLILKPCWTNSYSSLFVLWIFGCFPIFTKAYNKHPQTTKVTMWPSLVWACVLKLVPYMSDPNSFTDAGFTRIRHSQISVKLVPFVPGGCLLWTGEVGSMTLFLAGKNTYHPAELLWTAPALLDSTQESCDLGQTPQSLASRYEIRPCKFHKKTV